MVNFNAQGGTAIASKTGLTTTLPAPTEKVSNKSFAGWSKTANSTKVDYAPGQEYSGKDRTLYAVWGEGELTAKLIAENPTAYYGRTVSYTGYGTTTLTGGTHYNGDWRIFHADANRNKIYLISERYISYYEAPLSINGAILVNHTSTKNNDYCLSMDNVKADYTGARDRDKAIAFMKDSSTNVWGIFKNSDAEWAHGGPDILEFTNSYKATHKGGFYIIPVKQEDGSYKVKWNADRNDPYTGSDAQMYTGDTTENYRAWRTELDSDKIWYNMYRDTRNNISNAYWIASSSPGANAGIFQSSHNGSLRYNNSETFDYGFRPLVCLKAGVNVELK